MDLNSIQMGVLKDTNPLSGTPASNNRDLFIGKHDAFGRYFYEVIDEVCIDIRTLSEIKIRRLKDLPPCEGDLDWRR